MSDSLPTAYGAPVLQARLRSLPEDFQVTELLGFSADGRGEHLFLEVEKRGANTAWVAAQLARWAGVAESAVSYAGLKDRHALTRQTFSLHLPGREAPAEWPQSDEFRVLSACRHSRKLQRGALRGNRFELLLREVQGERTAIEQRLTTIARQGVPNYFGEQRFGRDGDNVQRAKAMFAGRRVRRDERSILLSAARSALFNHVLAERVAAATWHQALDGEVLMLNGTHSVFGPEPITDELRGRVATGDIHPTGPLWGAGELRSQGPARAADEKALAVDPALIAGLIDAGLKQERRALRLPVAELSWDWPSQDALRLRFVLPAGAYATAVVRELGGAAGSINDS